MLKKGERFHGFLFKQRPNVSDLRKGWQRRWFSLRERNGECSLHYFEYDDDPHELGRIDVCSIVDVIDTGNGRPNRSLHQSDDDVRDTAAPSADRRSWRLSASSRQTNGWVFRIDTPTRKYFLMADTEQEMWAWIQAISSAQLLSTTIQAGDGVDPQHMIQSAGAVVRDDESVGRARRHADKLYKTTGSIKEILEAERRKEMQRNLNSAAGDEDDGDGDDDGDDDDDEREESQRSLRGGFQSIAQSVRMRLRNSPQGLTPGAPYAQYGEASTSRHSDQGNGLAVPTASDLPSESYWTRQLLVQLKTAKGKLTRVEQELALKDRKIYSLMHGDANGEAGEEGEHGDAEDGGSEADYDTDGSGEGDLIDMSSVDPCMLSLGRDELYAMNIRLKRELEDLRVQMMAEHKIRTALQKENELLSKLVSSQHELEAEQEVSKSAPAMHVLIEEEEERRRKDAAEVLGDVVQRPASTEPCSAFDLLADTWMPDHKFQECPACRSKFNFFVRRHHCRFCGSVFCQKCTSSKIRVNEECEVRCCDVCFDAVSKRIRS